jgi:cytochrome c
MTSFRDRLRPPAKVLAIMMGAFVCAFTPGHAESPTAHSFSVQVRPPVAASAPGPALAARAARSALPIECLKSPAQWRTWRSKAVRSVLATRPVLENQAGPFLDPDQVAAQSVAVHNFIQDCQPPSGVASSLANLQQFTETQVNGLDVDHQLNHGPADLDYIHRVKNVASMPCLLRSPEFLERISDPGGYSAALELITRQNKGDIVGGCPPDGAQWETLIYRSAFLGTPDDADTYGRFLVIVPGDTHDRWIQFGIWTPDDAYPYNDDRTFKKINNVSVVAAAKNRVEGDGRYTALVDWWRVYGTSGIGLTTRREATGHSGNCQGCHKTAVVGIHTEQFYKFENKTLVAAPELRATVENLNLRLQNRNTAYVLPTQSIGEEEDAVASTGRYGPPLGPEDERVDTKPAFMKACTAPYQLGTGRERELSIQRIATAMNCAECHSEKSKGVGSLNFPLTTIRTQAKALEEGKRPNLIYWLIQRKIMPPKGKGAPPEGLNDQEAEALYKCLTTEYFDERGKGLFANWLNGAAEKPPAPSAFALAALAAAMNPNRSAAPRTVRAAVAVRSGDTDFQARCARCHATKPGDNESAPSLFGVFGRASGTVPGFAYSAAYVEAGQKGVRWDESNLLAFLIDQQAFLSKTLKHPATSEMDKHFPDEALRRSIVGYLQTLH